MDFGFFKSRVIPFLPLLRAKKDRPNPGTPGIISSAYLHGSPVGGSILIISAPISLSIDPAKGAAII